MPRGIWTIRTLIFAAATTLLAALIFAVTPRHASFDLTNLSQLPRIPSGISTNELAEIEISGGSADCKRSWSELYVVVGKIRNSGFVRIVSLFDLEGNISRQEHNIFFKRQVLSDMEASRRTLNFFDIVLAEPDVISFKNRVGDASVTGYYAKNSGYIAVCFLYP